MDIKSRLTIGQKIKYPIFAEGKEFYDWEIIRLDTNEVTMSVTCFNERILTKTIKYDEISEYEILPTEKDEVLFNLVRKVNKLLYSVDCIWVEHVLEVESANNQVKKLWDI